MMNGVAFWLRRALLALGGVGALLLLLAVGTLLLLQTPPAKRVLAERLAAELAAATGFAVEIGGLEGTLPLSARLTDIKLADRDGTWLTADRLELGWQPRELLSGRLVVTGLTAGEVALLHLPQSAKPPEPAPTQPGLDLIPALPQLPLPVTVEKLRVERITLAPMLLGEPAVLSLDGQAALGGAARDARLELHVVRQDGRAGEVEIHLSQAGTPPLLKLGARIAEPAGGLIARLLSLPGLPAVSLTLEGDGPAAGWRGKLAATAGDAALAADLSLALEKTLALDLTGTARSPGFLAPAIAPYLPPALDLAARLRWQPGTELAIDRLALAAPEARAELAGTVDLAHDRLHGNAEVSIADATRWQPLLAPATLRTAHLVGSLSGALDKPRFELTAAVEGLTAPEVAAEHAEAKLGGEVALADRQVATGLSVAGQGTVRGLTTTAIDPRLAALAGTEARWSLDAVLDLVAGDLRLAKAEVAAGSLRLAGTGLIGDRGRRVDADLEGEVADLAPLSAVLAVPVSGRGSLKAHVAGDALRPELAVTVDGGLADFASANPQVMAVLGPTPTLAGRIDASETGFAVAGLELRGAGVSLTADGPVGADVRTVDLKVAAAADDIGGLTALAGVTAGGRLAADLRLQRSPADPLTHVAGTATLDDLTLDMPGAALLGQQVRASLEGALGDAGFDIAAARIEGAEATLSASGRVADALDLDYRLELPRLAALSSLAGVALAGSAEASGKVSGAMADPAATATIAARALRVADLAFDSLAADLTARNVATRPEGTAKIDIGARGQRLALASAYRLAGDGGVALTGLSATAPKTSISGDLAIAPGGLLNGRLRGDVGDLKAIGALLGQSLAGAAKLDLAFKPARKGQGLGGTVDLRNLALAMAGSAPLTVQSLSLDADLSDAFAAPGGKANLRLSEATMDTLHVKNATFNAEGAATAMRVRLEAAGEHGRPFVLKSGGELAMRGATQRLRLDSLDGNYGPIDLKLNAPATLARGPGGFELAGLDAAIGKGRLTGAGKLGGRQSDLTLQLTDLPLDIVTAFAPAVNVAGTASADLRVSGPPAAPRANAQVQLADMREAGTKVGEAVGIDGTITLAVASGRGEMTARLGGPKELDLDAQLAAPVAFRLQPFALSATPNAPMTGRVKGRIDLALVPQLIDLHGDALGGRLDADMTVAGTPDAPRLAGEAHLANGTYESAEGGTLLHDIDAVVSGDNDRVLLRSLSATDGDKGRLTASASARFGGAGAVYDGALELQHFTALRRNDATAVASGKLQLEDAATGARLAGDITIEGAELRIPERLPPTIVKIDVEEINAPPDRAAILEARAAEAQPARAGPPIALDVIARIPGRAFLRGRGIDTEWRGRLNVKGTVSKPDITGKLQVVRGGVDLIGKRFDVDNGTVTFIGGGAIDPDLDFTATGSAADVTAHIHVTGRASAPKLELSSDSGLPQDEVMSRILFGKGTGGLSPLQAAQLAQSASGLLGLGGGGGFFDRLRGGAGLDVLTVESTGDKANDSTVKAGKYISDDVFLKVEQGLTPGSRKVGVEVRVLPQITVEGDVGGQGDGSVGANWRYDY
jgi:translocation and assembly module TamB